VAAQAGGKRAETPGELTAWRLTRAEYGASAFSGIGSALRAGRWHLIGRPMVYAASSPSLALLETMANVDKQGLIESRYVVLRVRVPFELVEYLDASALPDDWQAWPHSVSTQRIGTKWFEERRSAALVVPSAIVPHDTNVLLNPQHADWRHVEVGEPEPFPIDARVYE
jgi:RES domain-containing protein